MLNLQKTKIQTTLIVTAILMTVGCADNQKQNTILDYSKSAEDLFDQAMERFDNEDCIEAEKQFQDVRRQFPYSKYASLSELKIADCHFSQGNHAEAAVAYQYFVKSHPTHEDTHYAAYRRGLSYYEMIPGDWGITPPPHERDQSAVRDARGAFVTFLRTYPTSKWHEHAEELLADVVDALVRHEMYVAEFYVHRKQLEAASVRLEGIRTHFPSSTLVPDAMFLQAVTFLKLDQPSEATRVFEEIVEHFPNHHQALRAKDYLHHMTKTHMVKNGG